jgi:hypothetical protein
MFNRTAGHGRDTSLYAELEIRGLADHVFQAAGFGNRRFGLVRQMSCHDACRVIFRLQSEPGNQGIAGVMTGR